MKKTLAFFFCVIVALLSAGCSAKSSASMSEQTASASSAEEMEIITLHTFPAAERFNGGSGTESDPYQIATVGQLALFAKVNTWEYDDYLNYNKCSYVLTADIQLNDTANLANWETQAPEYVWVPIADFAGQFDGNGHSISGVYIDAMSTLGEYDPESDTFVYAESTLPGKTVEDDAGLFASVSGSKDSECVISDLSVVDSCYTVNNSSGTGSIGSIMGTASSVSIRNCKSNVRISYTGDSKYLGNIGGICGWGATGTTLQNCVFEGSIRASGDFSDETVSGKIGGIVAAFSGSLIDCTNRGQFEIPDCSEDSLIEIGGIVCSAKSANGNVISGCINEADINLSAGNVGGVIGTLDLSYYSELNDGARVYQDGTITIENCVNNGDLSCRNEADEPTGGVIAKVFNSDSRVDTSFISGCVNNGNVTAGSYTGGVIGQVSNAYAQLSVTDCENHGQISGDDYIGGIIGECSVSNAEQTVSGCINHGSVDAEATPVGGIVAAFFNSNLSVASNGAAFQLENCQNFGDVASSNGITGTAGILGQIEENTEGTQVFVTSCENSGQVKSEGSARIGGILGTANLASNVPYTISNCTNRGALSLGDGKGLPDRERYNALVVDTKEYDMNENAFLLLGGSCVGGIVGKHYQGLIENCNNYGEIWLDSESTAYFGGIAGLYQYLDELCSPETSGIRNCQYSASTDGGYILIFETEESLGTIESVTKMTA